MLIIAASILLLALVVFAILAFRGKKKLENAGLVKSRNRPRVLESVLARIQQRVHYNNQIRKFADAVPADPKSAVAVLDAMEAAGVDASIVSYNSLLKAYVRAIPPQVQQALELLDRMERAGLAANQISYNTCLAACAQQGLPIVAQSLIDRMVSKNIDPNVFSYNSLINAFANVEPARADEAMKTLQLMDANGVRPDDVSFSLLIKAHGNASTASLALVEQLVEEMGKFELSAGPVFFNAAFRALAVSTEVDWDKWIEMMSSHGLEADESMYLRAIRGFTLSSRPRPKAAEKVVQTMLAAGHSPGTVGYTMLISAFGEKGDFGSAHRLLEQMIAEGLEPSSVTFTCILKAISRSANPAANLDKAESLVQQMQANDMVLNSTVYNVLLSCHANAKPAIDVERVHQILAEMESAAVELDTITFSTAATAFANAKPARPDLAEKMVRRAQSLGLKPDTVMYSTLIAAYANCTPAQGEKANAVLLEMEAAGVDANTVTYTSVINAYANSSPSKPHEAARLLKVMEERCIPYSTVTFNTIITSYTNARPSQPDRAEGVLQTMLQAGFTPDLITFSSLINAFGKVGRAEDSERLLAQLLENGLEPNTIVYTALIGAYANSQPARPEEAEGVIKRMLDRDLKPNEVSYAVVLKAYSSTMPGRPKDCLRVLNEMQAAKLPVDEVIYNTILRAFSNLGKPAFWDAHKLFENMIASGQTPTHVTYNTLLNIASRDHGQGVADKALALFKTIPLQMRDAYTYPPVLHIMANLANNRRPMDHEAIKTFNEARTNLKNWPNEHVFKAALRACPNERNKLQAMWNTDAKMNPNGYVAAKHVQRPTSTAEAKHDSRVSARQARCPRDGWAVLPQRVRSQPAC